MDATTPSTPQQSTLEKEIKRLKNAVEELTLLNDLAITASSSLEVDAMLDIIVQKSLKAVKAEQGSILLVTEEEGRPLKTLIRQENRSKHSLNYRVGDHITGWVLKYRKPLMIENLAMDDRFLTSEQEKKEIRSVLCVPIWFRAKLIGILMVTNKKTEPHFSDNDMRLLSIIAAQSGQLIRNSQLQQEAIEKKRLEQELELAKKIQLGLLPEKNPEVEGLKVSSFFKPADAVGGDYYDYFVFTREKIGIIIADVSGHGPSAAMTMTMVKGILHTIIKQTQAVDEILQQMNWVLSEILPRDVFVTSQIIEVDMKNRLLQFSNAGHNPVIFFDPEKQACEQIELRGCALNLIASATYQQKEIPFKEGDVFFIYTDGVSEAVNEKMEMFEDQRLIQAVESAARKLHSPEMIISEVKNRLEEFTGNAPQADDIAMIAFRVE